MDAIVTRKRVAGNRRPGVLQHACGVVRPRVRQVSPEHFGVVAVDCAKGAVQMDAERLYGNLLVPPAVVEHGRAGFGEHARRLNAGRIGRNGEQKRGRK